MKHAALMPAVLRTELARQPRACSHKVIQQIDGTFEPPMIFQDRCLACWDCIEACPLDAVVVKQVS